MAEQERRVLSQPLAVRTADDGPRIGGYAARFNAETVIAGLFRERIAPGAFAEAVSRDDVRALFNHDANWVLGRTKSGTLTLAEDEQGLRYEVVLNQADPDAASVLAKVQRGDVDGSSFAFSVDAEEWDYPPDAMPLRTIRAVHLFDVSPVAYPAYDTTSVSARTAAAKAPESDGGASRQRAHLRLDEVA